MCARLSQSNLHLETALWYVFVLFVQLLTFIETCNSGLGDFHEEAFTKDGMSIALTGDDEFAESSPTYQLTIYPSSEFNMVYSTRNPVVSSIGAVLAILVTSACFIVYDCLVNRDLRLKKQMFVAGWNHRKRYEEGMRRSENERSGNEQEDIEMSGFGLREQDPRNRKERDGVCTRSIPEEEESSQSVRSSDGSTG